MLFDRIKELCEKHQTNFSKLERDCGLSNATIRRWEKASPTADNVAKVADYFGVSVDFLLGRDDYSLSSEAQDYAKKFDALSEEKKKIVIAHMSFVQTQ